MSALVRSAKGKSDSILISENGRPFFELGIYTLRYPTREPESSTHTGNSKTLTNLKKNVSGETK